ncbi:chromosomal replication initiator protein DnaA [Granulicatella sp. zg-ZJ]|uniref:chromosomal replication initiator protein DnaA n=1 Tax=unclassified Granulicatella TaxID=2630493 RepID=UPI0013BFF553|nr:MULTISPECIES: chromosomal replication initiator protein DnaA [unclassified Granulicatella]MBS4750243.1 chromosomal replication initiator protein DnaA [Carnobacteriaceae bacterium zg-ZUI78]NEW62484.1 chromosomal replication initiator protein DnaA [Granulicatella sp. zg-ZJ]NEW66911.1 chromosomal replication initiator protein DnaA [Granulicatella sp. zg-84]QMI85819.1 chromosomal replication initiator protein DnaA [Carnobacteriaceae bacterium zg-84]
MNHLDDIWHYLLVELKKLFTKGMYEIYIESAKPIKFEQNCLTLLLPEMIHKQTWENLILNSATYILRTKFEQADISLILEEQLPKQPVSKIKNQRRINLNPNYTFDSFVVGSGNTMAHAAALVVSQSPGTAYNPLFIYGGSGLGKTHLMHAIGNTILRNNPSANIHYVTSETFTNDFINSIQTKSQEEFRNHYRNVDLLMVDDIQFLANKESTLEEFFHTFNALHESGKQIVLTSDRLASEIPELPDRLVSRFGSGLSSDITPPDLETRTAILRKKAISNHINIPDDTLNYIAGQVNSNVRDLEAALTRVNFYSLTNHRDIDTNLAAEALKDIVSVNAKRTISIYDVQIEVGKIFSVTIEQLKGKKRNKDIVIPRQIAMYLSREITGNSLPKIGQEFGGKDHTTVMHACDKIQQTIDTNSDMALIKQIEQIRKKLEK